MTFPKLFPGILSQDTFQDLLPKRTAIQNIGRIVCVRFTLSAMNARRWRTVNPPAVIEILGFISALPSIWRRLLGREIEVYIPEIGSSLWSVLGPTGREQFQSQPPPTRQQTTPPKPLHPSPHTFGEQQCPAPFSLTLQKRSRRSSTSRRRPQRHIANSSTRCVPCS